MNTYNNFIHRATSWNQLKCPSTGEWMDQPWFTHMMEYYSAVPYNPLLILSALWLDLKCILRSDRSHQKSYILWSSIYKILRKA